MNEFIAGHPSVAIWFIGLLGTVLGLLGASLAWMVKKAIDRLILAIDQLKESLDAKDKEISDLKARMTGMEATCSMQRENCQGNTHYVPMNPTMVQVSEVRKNRGL